jgi:DNA-binding FadR family transcriptional regulator
MELRATITNRGVRNSHALVVNEIGRAIVSGVYPVDTILPGDADLAESFQVSRTVLREAMKTLTAKGLIMPRAGIGTRVTRRTSWNLLDADVLNWHFESGVDEAFLGHLCDMRLSFEPQAARLAARVATEGDLARLREHAEQMRFATSTEEFALRDLAFHMAVLDMSGNPFMYSVGALIEAALASAFRLSSPADDPDQQSSSAAAHMAIADAIAAGDADAAAQAMSDVIVEGRDRVVDSMLAREWKSTRGEQDGHER